MIEPLLRPAQGFLAAESAGGVVLLATAVLALLWANSPWGDSYASVWHAKASLAVGGFGHAMVLQHVVNDGLMAVFFLLVGLEIKREVLLGELASVRRSALPVAAAFGGMAVPTLFFALVTFRTDAAAGWGVPMATDIAFAVGVLAIVGRSLPASVKVFLLAIAIVDDLGAILVIAFFYTAGVSLTALAVAGGFFASLVMLNLLKVHRPLPYVLIGAGLWAATLASGVHATVSGVLLAFTIPATRQVDERPFVDYVRKIIGRFGRDADAVPDRITADQSHAIKAIERAAQGVQTPLARVEHALLKPVNFLIVPLFALANAGVDVRGGILATAADPVTWGVLAGLCLGKPVGVMLFSWLAVRTRVASLPHAATHRQLFGVALLCGIGFTMSLFVANLAYPNQPRHLAAAKVGILAASVLSGLAGIIVLASGKPAGKEGEPQGHRPT